MGMMDSSNTALVVDGNWPGMPHSDAEDVGPPAILRGTARGLEMVVSGRATLDGVATALLKRLEDAPHFFRGSDVRICVEDGPLAAGCLARLDELAVRFGLRIIEVAAASRATDRDAVPKLNLASGSAPSASGFEEEEPTNTAAAAHVDRVRSPPSLSSPLPPTLPTEPVRLGPSELTEIVAMIGDPFSFEEPTKTAIPRSLAASLETDQDSTNETRLIVGPVRSGVILDHAGHLVVFGDVNPGAEIRATGNIIVLGRLRGTAHAAIGQDVGFILALRLEPQQLRIARMVARAGAGEVAAAEAEIAYCTDGSIVVERYQGKLPRSLATSI